VIGDEMAFQVTYIKTEEEKWTEVTSLPYSLPILDGIRLCNVFLLKPREDIFHRRE